MDQPDEKEDARQSWVSGLRQRNLVQWLIAYAAFAWLLVQVADVIGPRWGFSDAASRILDIVLIFGFFVAVVLAWYHGEKGRQRVSGPELLMIGVLLTICALTVNFLSPDPTERPPASSPTQPREAESGQSTELNSASHPKESIAVLPFDNFSPNSDDAYFAAGITEEITSQLARIGALTVLSRVAVERAMKSDASLEGIARQLRAGTVLEGSVRMAGNQVRITAQLVDMSDGSQLWSESFDRNLDDIFQIQTDVALAIGNALTDHLTSAERQRIEKPITSNLKAYQLYLKQIGLLGNIPEQNDEGIRLLEEAIELDPEFATAIARLSWRHGWRAWMEGDAASAKLAKEFASKALEVDPEVPYGHVAQASVLISEDKVGQALESYDRALDLNPSFRIALTDSSAYLSLLGQFEPALRRAFRAVQLNPNEPVERWHAVLPLLFIGDANRTEAWLDLAEAEGMKMARLDIARVQLELLKGDLVSAADRARSIIKEYDDEPEALNWASTLLFTMGHWREVRTTLEKSGQEAPNGSISMLVPRRARTQLGFIHAETGDSEMAEKLFKEGLAFNAKQADAATDYYISHIDLAAIHAYQGRSDEAMLELEQAFASGFLTDFALRIDPMFESLRDEPRFRELLNRIRAHKEKLQVEAEASGAFDAYDQMIAAGPSRTGE